MSVLGLSVLVILLYASTDTSRVGNIPQNQSPAGTLRVLEVDLTELKLSNPSNSVWPESAPNVDGVIVCYDASNEKSFVHVEKLIGLWPISSL